MTDLAGCSEAKKKLKTGEMVEGVSGGLRSNRIGEMNNLSRYNNGSTRRTLPLSGYENVAQFEENWTSSSSSSSNDDISDEDAPWRKAKRKNKGKQSKSSERQMPKKHILLPPNSTIDWDNNPLTLQKILAYKELTKAQWRKKMGQMNTRFVKCGSMWNVEKEDDMVKQKIKQSSGKSSVTAKEIPCSNHDNDDVDEKIGCYLIRWNGLSYLHVTWELFSDIEKRIGTSGTQYVSRFHRKYGETARRGQLSPEEEWGGGFFNSECCEVDRVLNMVQKTGTDTQLLIKWLGCSYSELSYETISDLDRMGVNHEDQIGEFLRRENVRARKKLLQEAKDGRFWYPTLSPNFKNKGKLRDHQLVGVKWMLANWAADRCSILADEMGLGKTLQCLTVVWWLLTKAGQSGPCLIVAPLSTLEHWKREAEEWTGLNTVVYHGSQSDRDAIIEHEMLFVHAKGKPSFVNGEKLYKPQVIITTPGEVIQHFAPLRNVKFSMLVVDEAQRLKNANGALNKVLIRDLDWESCILLTGTPIQNNVDELWALLSFVDPHSFDDREGFVSLYGDITVTQQVSELHSLIQPYLLRRMKEDVEKSVPPKQETIVEVELTAVQKQYYRALYEQNTEFLMQGGIRNGPSLMNLAMELRKCCNHPYLIKGAENAIHTSDVVQGSETDKLVMSSGKLVLLDKLLPHLEKQGHRVLIFSQFVMLLDILDDYLRGRNYIFGRIDGCITGKERQRAIDRFQAPDSNLFIMLLSTKAGGQGINLTAADTVIIYDSDWNPQNDIQAQARCHRIGQTKNVKIYRLLTTKTYEQVMFRTASRKLGLDQAILQHEQRKSNSMPQLSSKEVENLLKHGAYDVFCEDEKDSNGNTINKNKVVFEEESIDSILSRSETRTHGGGSKDKNMGGTNGSNEFSKASFISKEGITVDIDDPEFWVKVVGLKVPEKNHKGLDLGKRAARASVDYRDQVRFGGKMDVHGSEDESVHSSDLSSDEERSGSDIEAGPYGMVDDWTCEDLDVVLKQMLLLGYGQTNALAAATLSKRRPEEIKVVSIAIVAHMFLMVVIDLQEEAACKLVQQRKLDASKTLISSASAPLPTPPFMAEAETEDGGMGGGDMEEDTGDTSTNATEKKDLADSEASVGGEEDEVIVIESDSKPQSDPPSKDNAATPENVQLKTTRRFLMQKRHYSAVERMKAMDALGASECADLLKIVSQQCYDKHEVCRHALKAERPCDDQVLIAKMAWKPRRLYRVMDGLKKADKKLTQLDDLLEVHRVSSFTKESLDMLMMREPRKPCKGWTSDHDIWLLKRVVEVGWPTTKIALKKLMAYGWPGGCDDVPCENICTLKVVKSRLKSIIMMTRKVRKLLRCSIPQKNLGHKGMEALQAAAGGARNAAFQQDSVAAIPPLPMPTDKLNVLTHVGQKMHTSLQRRAEKAGMLDVTSEQEVPRAPMSVNLRSLMSSYTSSGKPWGENMTRRMCCAMQVLGVPLSLLRDDIESEWLLPYCLVLRGADVECDPAFVRQLELDWERLAEFANIDVNVAKTLAIAMLSVTTASNPVHMFSVKVPSHVPQFWLPEFEIMDNTRLLRVAAASRLRQVLRLLGTWDALLKLCWQLSFIPCVAETVVPSWWSKGYHDAKLLLSSVLVGYSDEVVTIIPLLKFQIFKDGRSICDDYVKDEASSPSVSLQPRLDALRAGVLYWAKAPDSFYGKAHTKAVASAMHGMRKTALSSSSAATTKQ